MVVMANTAPYVWTQRQLWGEARKADVGHNEPIAPPCQSLT